MSQQSLRQASVRFVTDTEETYEGDFHALFDYLSIPAGDFNGRFLAFLNMMLEASYQSLPEAMQKFAEANGAFNFSSLGTFDVTINGVVVTLLRGADGQALMGADGQYLFGAA